MPESVTNNTVVQALVAVIIFVSGVMIGVIRWISNRTFGRIDSLEESSQHYRSEIDHLASANEIRDMTIATLNESIERSERQHKELLLSNRRETDRRLAFLEAASDKSRRDLHELMGKHLDALKQVLRRE